MKYPSDSIKISHNQTIIFIVTCLFFVSWSVLRAENEMPRAPTSCFTVLSNIDSFHDKIVIINGVLRFRHDNHSLFPTMEFYNENLIENAFWLAVDKNDPIAGELADLDGKWVRIVGKINGTIHGHFHLFPAGIHIIEFSPRR